MLDSTAFNSKALSLRSETLDWELTGSLTDLLTVEAHASKWSEEHRRASENEYEHRVSEYRWAQTIRKHARTGNDTHRTHTHEFFGIRHWHTHTQNRAGRCVFASR